MAGILLRRSTMLGETQKSCSTANARRYGGLQHNDYVHSLVFRIQKFRCIGKLFGRMGRKVQEKNTPQHQSELGLKYFVWTTTRLCGGSPGQVSMGQLAVLKHRLQGILV